MVRLVRRVRLLQSDLQFAFQSHRGSISTERAKAASKTNRSFNPTVVRLVPMATWCLSSSVNCFNPTVVRLVLSEPYGEFTIAVCFNPTVVRLVPVQPDSDMAGWFGFNPTVVRLVRCKNPQGLRDVQRFQSHRGSISTLNQVLNAHLIQRRFNPTVVRLVQLRRAPVTLSFYCFNPTVVRLVPGAAFFLLAGCPVVSIPPWFD